MRKISQRHARRIEKTNKELWERLSALTRQWGRDYPGTHLLTLDLNDLIAEEDLAIVKTAQRLGVAVVVRFDESGNRLNLYGVKS